MKRHHSFRLLVLILFVCLSGACKGKFPSSPTIVTGTVVDEAGVPVKGIELTLSGTRVKGFSPIPTFDEDTETDSAGRYKLSYVVGRNTDFVEIAIVTNNKYFTYVKRDGRYEILTSSFTLQHKEYGKTKNVNFQIKKI
ncbi:hypothetical protein [Persicitalea sp.]|uniref:hypothetical protein n=1 Tax=Persicitalea sp. TaxID=3100273 RepID=UPI003593C3DE